MESTIRTRMRWIGHGLRLAMVRSADELDEQNVIADVINTVGRWICIGMVYILAAAAGAGLAAWQIGALL